MFPEINRHGLSGNQLKLVAAVSMLADHIGYRIIGNGILIPMWEQGQESAFWLNLYYALRIIGRISFPIFCFLLVEGYFHTRSKGKYGLRLGLFGLLSEIPFDYMSTGKVLDWETQNVMFTLLLGFLMLGALEKIRQRFHAAELLQMGVIVLFAGFSALLKSDYSYGGTMLIALLYWFRQDRVLQCGIGLAWMALFLRTPMYVSGLALGFGAVYCYNGSRGIWKGRKIQYFFYLFYPLHMLAVALLYHFIF